MRDGFSTRLFFLFDGILLEIHFCEQIIVQYCSTGTLRFLTMKRHVQGYLPTIVEAYLFRWIDGKPL